MALSIETFQHQYQPQIVEMIVYIQQQEFGVDITSDQQPDLKNIPNFYQSGKGNFWIALEHDRVIGTIALLDIGQNEVALRKMFVHEGHRGKEKGVAKKLLDTLFIWVKKQGINQIYLGTTPVFLAAHRFYEKNGFIEILQDELPETFPVLIVDKKFYKFTVQDSIISDPTNQQ